LSVYIVIFTDT